MLRQNDPWFWAAIAAVLAAGAVLCALVALLFTFSRTRAAIILVAVLAGAPAVALVYLGLAICMLGDAIEGFGLNRTHDLLRWLQRRNRETASQQTGDAPAD